MNVLELFAGSRSIGKEAENLGMYVFSTDIKNFENINYVVDIFNFEYHKIKFQPDIIWASPPCTTFSIASVHHHWKKENDTYKYKTEAAKIGLDIINKTLDIINYFKPKFFFIENPRGMLRKMPIIKHLKRHTITYCQYGDDRMKPTDIWTNSHNWIPKQMCKNGDNCHISAKRGSKTGTQGRNNAYERSKIPTMLCQEILKSCI